MCWREICVKPRLVPLQHRPLTSLTRAMAPKSKAANKAVKVQAPKAMKAMKAVKGGDVPTKSSLMKRPSAKGPDPQVWVYTLAFHSYIYE